MRKVKWALLAALLVCITPLLTHVFNTWQYTSSDSIEKARIDTEHILTRFKKTRNADEVNAWLMHGPTEAPRTQINITLGQWALQNRNDFVNIIEDLPAKQRAKFIELFCNSLNQTSLGMEFKATFKANKSKSITAILEGLA